MSMNLNSASRQRIKEEAVLWEEVITWMSDLGSILRLLKGTVVVVAALPESTGHNQVNHFRV